MTIEEVSKNENIDFTGIPSSYYLLGLISAFDNRFQAMADSTMKEISWKQFFAIICINMCKEPPTLKELSDILGSSHQNVKQILLKLEHKGFVSMMTDKKDKRKQRYFVTDKCRKFLEDNDNQSRTSAQIIEQIFEGVDENSLMITIETIMKMERNLEKI